MNRCSEAVAGESRIAANFRDMELKLHTVGYEGRSPEEFVETLIGAGVTRLVDVRELPLSRKKGFSKTALREALEKVGIEYLHIRALGNPKPNRERYWAGDVEGGASAYRDHLLNNSQQELDELLASLDDQPACLMCFEKDHEVCHRDVIVGELRERQVGLAVEHL